MQAGFGIIGGGSMYPDTLRDHIRKCKAATKSFAVNVPMIYPDIEQHINIIMEEAVKIVSHRQVIPIHGQAH